MGNSFDMYIPICKTKVECHSKLLDNIGDFSKFIIWSIGSHKTKEEISKVVNLSKNIVDDEINDLYDYSLIDDDLTLTDLGEKYFALINCITKLENEGMNAYIDLFTGDVTLKDCEFRQYKRDEISSDSIVLNRKVSNIFFKNDNYQNSLYEVKKKLKDSKLLDEMYMDSLYTTLSIESGSFYARFSCSGYSFEETYHLSSDEPVIKIAVPIGIYHFKQYYTALDEYREVYEMMKKLTEYDDLLSYKGQAIVNAFEKENMLQPIIRVYDLYSRCSLDNYLLNKKIKRDDKDDLDCILLNGHNLRLQEKNLLKGSRYRSEFTYERS